MGDVSLSIMDVQQELDSTTFCWFPRNRNTNDVLKKLQTMGDRFNLYFSVLGSNPKVCAADLVIFVLKHLDEYLKQVVLERMNSSSSPDDLMGALVGTVGFRPFQDTSGDSLRYSKLLLFTTRTDEEDEDDDASAAQRLLLYEDLLFVVESLLLQAVKASDAPYTGEQFRSFQAALRLELHAYLTGQDKKERDVAAHVFSDLLWTDYKNPLDSQQLGTNLPFAGCRYAAFKLQDPDVLRAMAIKVLILQDLRSQYNQHLICVSTPWVANAAFHLIQAFIKKNVAVSHRVAFGDMVAEIPGQAVGFDLLTLDALSLAAGDPPLLL